MAPYVKKGDIFVPEALEDAIKGIYAGMSVMKDTGAVLVKTGMPAGKAQVGSTVTVPYFGTIGDLQDLTNDGQALTPRGISETTETATVKHSGIAIEATWWAQASSADDPYGEMARQVKLAVERKIDAEAMAAAVAAGSSLLTHDVYSASVPVKINFNDTITARMKWGDEQRDIAAMVMHSKVQGDAYQLADSTGRPLYVDGTNPELGRFAGMPTFVSDRLSPTSDSPPKYTTLLLKKDAIVFWIGESHMKTAEDVLSDSQLNVFHIYWAVHRYVRHPNGSKSGVVKFTHN